MSAIVSNGCVLSSIVVATMLESTVCHFRMYQGQKKKKTLPKQARGTLCKLVRAQHTLWTDPTRSLSSA